MSFKYVISLFLAGMSIAASAHMLPKGDATLNLKGDKGYLVVSVAASALTGADDDNDGMLGPAEIDRHRLQLQKKFGDGFLVSSAGKNAPLAFVWVTHPDNGEAEQAPSDYIIFLAGAGFSKPPETVTVKNLLYGTNTEEKQIMLTVTRGAQKQEAMLYAEQPSHEFFSRSPAASNWAIWAVLIALLAIVILVIILRRRLLKPGS